MLSYISHKFAQDIPTHTNEPRAALFLNRFSRTLAIMYATNGLAEVLGITADQLIGKSFYFCIQENCLREAVKCLESAKANDSIAYLRFWYRDPTQDNRNVNRQDQDEHMSDGHSSGDDDGGGVHLSEIMDQSGSENAVTSDSSNSLRSSVEPHHPPGSLDPNSRSSSGNSTDMDGSAHDPIFDQPAGHGSRTSSISTPDEPPSSTQPWSPEPSHIELEAVVSCTSDGLVVILRRAKPFVPHISQSQSGTESVKHQYTNGFFASPWANDPIIPNIENRANPLPDSVRPAQFPIHPTAAQANTAATKGPASEDFMNSIREVAVFAWALTGINGSLEKYGRGTPGGESLPPGGYPIWDPSANAGTENHVSLGPMSNGYNYSHISGLPIDRMLQANSSLINTYQNNMSLDHQYTNPAPSNDFYEPNQDHSNQNCNYDQYHQDQMQMQTSGYGHNSSIDGYPVQTQDFGYDVQSANGGYFNQDHNKPYRHQSQDKPFHGSVQETEYDPYAGKQCSTTTHGQDQDISYQHAPGQAEYDPYAPAAYQAPGSNDCSARDLHSGTRWETGNATPPPMNGGGHVQ